MKNMERSYKNNKCTILASKSNAEFELPDS